MKLLSITWVHLVASASLAAPVDFIHQVRPILEQHCYSCHGPEKQKSGLRFDIKSEALRGGDSHAPNIHIGKAAESPLIHFITTQDEDTRMPPKGERLSAEEIALLTRWIDEGAAWPDGVDVAQAVDKRDHWAFKPIQPLSGSLDSFVETKLKEKQLSLSQEADKRSLIRRLYLVLHGLQPTPEEVESFIADNDPKAYENLVDRLLASPRYGERWARHWLDVIAFGETHGFEVNTPRPNAWPYRDYVIEAFNKDTPYPQFILEQLAGDTVGKDAATGFIVANAALLPGQIGKDEESKAKARQDELNDMVSITGGAFLGLTLHCARCHDHKFDPVSQTDYYSLQAIFAGVRHGERPLKSADAQKHEEDHATLLLRLAKATHRLLKFEPPALSGTQRTPVHPHRNLERFAPVTTQKLRFTVSATSDNNRYEPCLDELEIYSTSGQNIALASLGAKASASGSWSSDRHRLEHVNDGLYGNSRSWISKTKGGGWVQIEFPQATLIEGIAWGRDRLDEFKDRLPVSYRIEVAQPDGSWLKVADSTDRQTYPGSKAKLAMPQPENVEASVIAEWHDARGELNALETRLSSSKTGPMVYAGRFEQPSPIFKLNRGDVTQPKEEVVPAAVSAIGSPMKLAGDLPEQKRRVALAQWLADPANPLPARVLVNRLWQHHFGEGIVATPNDFGRNGAMPTHPELLSGLAAEFIRSGWSIKHMQKLIVMSRTWRQSSAPNEAGLAADAQTRLLWRYPPRRVEAEVVRDGMLEVAGTLDLKMGGPGFSVFAPNSNYVRVYDPRAEFGPEEWRRMIYMTKVRMAQDATFGSFDCPDAGQGQPKRPRSTTAIQALSLFNSGFVNQQAELFAQRLQKEAGNDLTRQIERAFALTAQRSPAPDEAQVCATLAREHGLPAVCRVLLNTNEFLFVP
ncbi:Planctomycete cytochrome C [Prosthecobacter debontii]|uniref:Planctomycete cytochrome C n=1 Tax=Prosthecobacter debontii TaxID=48467 RepID=A0A1T4WTK4_9BACT|nr:PSD1 and planctomycete cytochrome C domain-containing protein [Prosthecobacter debontii]SKA79941.1 Planctomycete cytochrome C [Prosthecobacter debontii]